MDAGTVAAPCSGLRVVELGQGMAGTMPGMILADAGADVVKIEPPWGDWGRRSEGSRMWNRGKRSVVLDLRQPDALEAARRLASGADVLIESFRPGVADRLGLGAELRAENPQLVYCSISGFGPVAAMADLPGYEGLVAAVSGHMAGLDILSGAVPGQDRAGPIYTAVPVASFAAAQLAVQGVLAALLERNRSGRGDWVSTSLVQGLAAILMRQEMGRGPAAGAPIASPAMNAGIELCFMTARCADGRYLQMCARQDHHFAAWLGVLGLESRLEEPRYRGAPMGIARVEDVAELDAEIRQRMLGRSSEEWMAVFIAGGVGADPFLTPKEFLGHPQMVANDRVLTVDDPDVGPCRQVAPLARFVGWSPPTPAGAPRLGEHTQEVLDRPWSRRPFSSPGTHSALPLSGVTVVEVAYFLAGPLAGTLLAEMGARVIKIEPPGGDPARRLGLQSSKLFHGKESIVVDLKAPGGKQVILDLVDRADVFLHSFRPGVVERLGLDAASLLDRNPQLVHVHGASYGSQGPQAGRAAFHSTPNALCGSGMLQAGVGNAPVDDSYPDPGSALGLATAILLGLHARQRLGRGQVIETTMLCTTGYAMSPWMVDYEGVPEWQLPDGGQHGTGPLHRLYRAESGWVFVSCLNDRHWVALAEAVARPDWVVDERFATAAARQRHNAALEGALVEVLATRAAGYWHDRARESEAPLVAVSDVPKDRWMQDQNILVEAEHAIYGSYWRPPAKVHFDRFRSRMDPAAAPGEHTRELLEELGRAHDEIDKLLQCGAVDAWRGHDVAL